jgi:hypothetical protein
MGVCRRGHRTLWREANPWPRVNLCREEPPAWASLAFTRRSDGAALFTGLHLQHRRCIVRDAERSLLQDRTVMETSVLSGGHRAAISGGHAAVAFITTSYFLLCLTWSCCHDSEWTEEKLWRPRRKTHLSSHEWRLGEHTPTEVRYGTHDLSHVYYSSAYHTREYQRARSQQQRLGYPPCFRP